MAENPLQSIYQRLSTESEAGQRGLETLLNCYCREVASPDGQVSIGPRFGQNDWPLALRPALKDGQVMHILLPRVDTRLLVVVEQVSLTGNYRYSSQAYHKTPGRPWTPLAWETLATLLLQDLSLKYDQPFNHELLAQIRDSVAVTQAILAKPAASIPVEPLAAFLHSEQLLRYGHPFHPAPKSRQGFSEADLPLYSPELQARFPLHYFAVRRELLVQRSLLVQSCDALVAEHAQLEPPTDFALLPVHPWQGRYLLDQPLVQNALARDLLRDLGPQGADYFPTSSIRTLFQPGNPYFYKLSLQVRITNCVRKNAIYELDGALAVTRILRGLQPDLAARFPSLRLMEEPAYQSLDLRDPDRQANQAVTEGFGMILRQGLQTLLDPGVTPILAGALFGNQSVGKAWVDGFVKALAAQKGLSRDAAAEAWFAAYIEQILHPVLYCFFVHGLIFEPHLQNVLIGVQNARPTRLFLRDFEGVKLVPGRFPAERLTELSERAREALWYSEDQGWNRIAYCLFVNNICEAVAQLSGGRPALEARLWAVVGQQLRAYQTRFGDATSARRINALLAGQPLPAKANLINRFFKRPDRAVSYVPLPNPLLLARGGVA
ncbi:IucA/IucC family protein [Thermithiobacillus plumbiphilus]|uniref:IucA/IucC family protein n=1 Tax=Thermithiobacillus plumbiphilus TaxID=1729899 RepID=A0ABU9DC19_9PROT